MTRRPRHLPVALAAAAVALTTIGLAAPAGAADSDEVREQMRERAAQQPGTTASLVSSDNIAQVSTNPTQVGISGCFTSTAPLFVTSGLDTLRVFDVSDAASPALTGVLPSVMFENEAMNCGERRTSSGTRRFALIGVDLVQASPDDIEHVNVGGGELVVVEVTDPSAPTVLSRAPGTTSTHTVACIDDTNCRYAYSAGGRSTFSIFDLRDLENPVEVDADRSTPGVQPFETPTGGHKWNFDDAGIGTHTGWNGASMWDVSKPRRPRVLTTTGEAGQGVDPDHEGWNDFILHNSYRPHANRFKPGRKPSLRRGNVLLVTEEDYEQTDCSQAGSFQTWWVKKLNGKPGKIVPLDKVELSDLGTFPLPRGAFCSSHWFDYRSGGLVAAGFYGGGTQVLDVSDPRRIRTHAHAVWGLSEVWDSMWVPVFDAQGRRTSKRTNLVYSIDLVRGLDVYAVDVPGDGRGAEPPADALAPVSASDRAAASALPLGLVGVAMAGALLLRRRRAQG
ncbi:hypothetical protein I601_2517 [Nocardioides dokdonensis FR1436]|uniref:LVIVD repeat protein n=1 Tax=Nocardioides dokdonensis FR1436 TaxID=1300347 RepID=A0A1A9GMV5_9ACTN|nr:hypothetical protein [Nocardioides dokdonensis]ANH38933.1 hypothetical protein I601_2517 [Nocardioides dokdonensis FR1436]